MNESTRRSLSLPQEEYEDTGSSEYEKREGRNMNTDEEKAVGLDGTDYRTSLDGDDGATNRGRSSRRPSHDSRSLKTIRSHHSRAGGDGYTCFDAEPTPHRPNKSNKSGGIVTEEPYLVTWDGDADPENPRSMTKLRRWIIVLICSASSLCVCVYPPKATRDR